MIAFRSPCRVRPRLRRHRMRPPRPRVPNPRRRSGVARLARQMLESGACEQGTGMISRVRDLIVHLLASGTCTTDRVAQHLGVRPAHDPPASRRRGRDLLGDCRGGSAGARGTLSSTSPTGAWRNLVLLGFSRRQPGFPAGTGSTSRRRRRRSARAFSAQVTTASAARSPRAGGTLCDSPRCSLADRASPRCHDRRGIAGRRLPRQWPLTGKLRAECWPNAPIDEL